MPGTLIIKPLTAKLTRDVDTFGKMVKVLGFNRLGPLLRYINRIIEI